MSQVWIWLILAGVFLLAEIVTVGALVSVWFCLGAIAGLISALYGAPVWMQISLFLEVSLLTLFLTRPLIQKFVNKDEQIVTGTNSLIGRTGFVTEEINNSRACGTVKIEGKLWSARSADGEAILKETNVTVLRIEGVKLIVEQTEAKNKKEQSY